MYKTNEIEIRAFKEGDPFETIINMAMWAGQALRITFSFSHKVPFYLSPDEILKISEFISCVNFQFKIGVIEINEV